MSALTSRIAAWAHRTMPTRESMEGHRLLGPFARRQELWRFTRRSVPRGVAVGLLIGIFALIPGVQIIGAALLCVPLRGNIPLAAAMTFLSNPGTTPFILLASIWVGNQLGFHADVATLHALYAHNASIGDWARWLLSDAAPALLLGLAIISIAAAAVSYLVTALGWRWWIARKRKARLGRSVPEPE
ncbi:MAG: DUF2062 domain-containing protein [Novosphingobium sp.]